MLQRLEKILTCRGPPVRPFKPCCACFQPVAVTFCTLSAALQHNGRTGQWMQKEALMCAYAVPEREMVPCK